MPAVISEEGVGGLRGDRKFAQGQRALLGRAVHRRARHRDLGRVALCGGHRVRGRAGRRRGKRRRTLRLVGAGAAGPAARRADRPEHRRHEQLAIQRAAHRQPREIHVVQPAAFHVGSARIAGDADRRRRRRQRAHRGDRLGRSSRSHCRRRSIRSSEGCFRSSTARWCSPTRFARGSSNRSCITRLQQGSSVSPSAGVSATTWSRGPQPSCCTASAATRAIRPVATLMLSLGPLIVPALLGMWPPWRLPRRAWPAVAGTVLGLLVFYLVRLSVEGSYIGFRAGQLMQLALPGLAALFFARLWPLDVARGRRRWRAAAATIAVVLVVIGLPTTLIDTYNAQDIGNRRMGPGFRWTITLTPDEQEAYRWMRTETPRDAIVQMDPIAHGRETWSQLPTFAERRMAAARPISLMNIPDYLERSRTGAQDLRRAECRDRGAARARARHRLHLHRAGGATGATRPLRWRSSTQGKTCSSRSSPTPARVSMRFGRDARWRLHHRGRTSRPATRTWGTCQRTCGV